MCNGAVSLCGRWKALARMLVMGCTWECAQCHGAVHLETVKMLSFVLDPLHLQPEAWIIRPIFQERGLRPRPAQEPP